MASLALTQNSGWLVKLDGGLVLAPGSLPLLPLQHQAQADLHRPLHQGGEAVGLPPGGENQQLRPPPGQAGVVS